MTTALRDGEVERQVGAKGWSPIEQTDGAGGQKDQLAPVRSPTRNSEEAFFLHLCALSGPRGGKQFSRLAERVRFVDHNRYRRVTGAGELYEIGERAYRRVTKIGPQLTDFGQKEPQLEILEIGLGREGRDVELLQRFGVFGLRARKATLLQLLDDAIVPITSVCICPQSTI